MKLTILAEKIIEASKSIELENEFDGVTITERLEAKDRDKRVFLIEKSMMTQRLDIKTDEVGSCNIGYENIIEEIIKHKDYLLMMGFVDDLGKNVDTGLRYNKGKPRMELIEAGFMEEVAKILTFGAEKYEIDNWKKFDNQKRFQTIGSLMRHLEGYRKGNKIDDESNCSHLCHIVANAMFLWWFDKNPIDK